MIKTSIIVQVRKIRAWWYKERLYQIPEARKRGANPRATPSQHHEVPIRLVNLQKIMTLRCATPGLSESNPTSGKMSRKACMYVEKLIEISE